MSEVRDRHEIIADLITERKANYDLRARVAKLERALKDVRIDFEMWHETTSIAKIDAALTFATTTRQESAK